MSTPTYKHRRHYIRPLVNFTTFLIVAALFSPHTQAEPVAIATGGAARLSITVLPHADDDVRRAAETLARYLGRISGGDFPVVEGDINSGIGIALLSSVPNLGAELGVEDGETRVRERYWIRSHKAGIRIVGASPDGLRHAIWDVLHHLGHRQFFPGDVWEVVPRSEDLSLDIDVDTEPDYLNRRIWYGYGTWKENKDDYAAWCERNRLGASVSLSTGHAYGYIIRACQESFDAHPEYYALVDGVRNCTPEAKLCISNPELRARVVAYAKSLVDADPALETISMDPSDGGGWCECLPCVTLGSPSDRALTLANTVAEAIQTEGQRRYVGIYAYNYHSPPPTIAVHPNVVVSVATAFLRGGYGLDEIIGGWSDKGATLGIREYYSVFPWDHDLPAAARGADLDYLATTILKFHGKGARYLSAESSENWGTNGLGYYAAARFMWDVSETAASRALEADFLDKAFGTAAAHMADFYAQVDGRLPHLMLDDQIGRMYGALQGAIAVEPGPEVVRRLRDLALYTRYVELFRDYQSNKGEGRQSAFEAVIRHAYRMRDTKLVHSMALYRDQVGRDKAVEIPEGAGWQVPESENPWKSSTPFSDEEITDYIAAGVERFPPVEVPFQPAAFSEELRPLPPMGESDYAPGNLGAGRGTQMYYTWAAEADSFLPLSVTGGLIYGDRGHVKIKLWKIGGESETGEGETLVFEDRSAAPDKETYTVRVPLSAIGLYRLEISDGGDLTRIEWPEHATLSVRSTLADPHTPHSRWSAWFYVPEGTKTLGLFSGGGGRILRPDGSTAIELEKQPAGYYHTAVAEDEAGQFWRVHSGSGAVRLMTVPPYFANSPSALLLPREVVEARKN